MLSSKYAVDDIIMQEKEKISDKYETNENINDEADEDDLCKLDKMSLDQKE